MPPSIHINIQILSLIHISCAALIGSNVLGGAGDKTIEVATKPMTEQYILGEMLKELVEQDTAVSYTHLDVYKRQGRETEKKRN